MTPCAEPKKGECRDVECLYDALNITRSNNGAKISRPLIQGCLARQKGSGVWECCALGKLGVAAGLEPYDIRSSENPYQLIGTKISEYFFGGRRFYGLHSDDIYQVNDDAAPMTRKRRVRKVLFQIWDKLCNTEEQKNDV